MWHCGEKGEMLRGKEIGSWHTRSFTEMCYDGQERDPVLGTPGEETRMFPTWMSRKQDLNQTNKREMCSYEHQKDCKIKIVE